MRAARWLVIAALGACGFQAGQLAQDGSNHPIDAAPDSALTCTEPTVTCSDDMTLASTCPGQKPVLETCGWGCLSTPTPRCGVVIPSGGAVSGSDFVPNAPNETFDGTTTPIFVDTDAATIMSGSAGAAIVHGHTVTAIGNGVTVFSFQNLQLSGAIYFVGTHAAAFVATGAITIAGVVDARSYACATGGATTVAGPGGFAGAAPSTAGAGSGSGGSAATNSDGGGGGGYAGAGAVGGYGGTTADEGAAGSAWGSAAVSVLIGGGGGGAGGGSNANDNGGGSGGGGGGAVQLVSNVSITIESSGGINVGGCGGGSGNGDDGGGGGGAGGAILLETPTLMLAGTLAANGGGGGGGDSPGAAAGSAGPLSASPAAGGAGHNGSHDEDGGSGGAGSAYTGPVPNHNGGHEGGGGGGVGYLRVNTLHGMSSVTFGGSAVLSPAAMATNSAATVGLAAVQ